VVDKIEVTRIAKYLILILIAPSNLKLRDYLKNGAEFFEVLIEFIAWLRNNSTPIGNRSTLNISRALVLRHCIATVLPLFVRAKAESVSTNNEVHICT